MSRTVFYSWQSDRPARCCRNFIEQALKDALKRLAENAELEVAERDEFELDRDTKNVPGSPPVFSTILEKISNASVFVPDLTFVGDRVSGRPTPNPNVLIEYGYALSKLGHSSIVAVMNSAFGEPTTENMPFNLGHLRFPIRYALLPDAPEESRRQIRANLSRDVEKALRATISSSKSAPVPQILSPRTAVDEANELAEEMRFQRALADMHNGPGLERVAQNVKELFGIVEQKCDEANSVGPIHLQCGSQFVDNQQSQLCVVRCNDLGMQIDWFQRWVNSDRDAKLTVRYFKGQVFLPGEFQSTVFFQHPQVTDEKTYFPTLSRGFEVGWESEAKAHQDVEFFTNSDLADICVRTLLQILRKRVSGRI